MFSPIALQLLFCCMLATGLSLLVTPLLARLARAMGLVDGGNARSVHRVPTPRVGGMAIFIATIIAVMASRFTSIPSDNLVGELTLQHLLLLAAGIFLVGFFDDLLNLSSKIKLVAIVAAATVMWAYGARFDAFRVTDTYSFDFGIFSWLMTVVFISAITVAMNFIDGLDGLAAGISAIALGSLAIVSAMTGQTALLFLSVSMLGALLGFLVFNFNPAKIFMGDCGSMFLGFTLGACGVIVAGKTKSVPATSAYVFALGVPIFDLAITMLRRRVLQRRSIFAAERGHIHHQMLDRGMSHRRVVVTLYVITAVMACLGLCGMIPHAAMPTAFVLIGSAIMAIVFYRAGSIQPSAIFKAYRRNISRARDHKTHRVRFEQMQLRFRNVKTFNQWWDEICCAAEMLQLISIVVPLRKRDGTLQHLRWDRNTREFDPDDRMSRAVTAVIPIRHRRMGPPIDAHVKLAVGESVEDASQRMMLFSRLTEEHSLATLTYDTLAERNPPADPVSTSKWGSEAMNLPVFKTISDSSGTEAKPSESPFISLTSEAPTSIDIAPRGETELSMITASTRIAVVHDFLYTYAGAERVLEQILHLYPHADLFSLFDFLPPGERGFIGGRTVKSSFIQKMPMARTKHRSYLPFMPLAIEQLDVSKYDLVISSSYVAAKGVITRPDQLHICYCHSPVRFAWDLQQQYLEQSGMTTGLKSLIARAILHYIRNWDTRCSNGVDKYVTNSNFVARRIEKTYRRHATTIYPPVDTESFSLQTEKDDFYLTASRLVPYKKVNLIVEAFSRMPNKRLIVIGDGPDAAKIKARAPSNVRFMGYQPFEVLRQYMQRARAFVFAAEEDFGIVPTEAQACGTPIIAFGRGGVTESVIPNVTGVFFEEQTCESLVDAVHRFEAGEPLNPHTIRKNAERFSIERFRENFGGFVENAVAEFTNKRDTTLRDARGNSYDVDQPASPFADYDGGTNGANGHPNAGTNSNGKHSVRT